MLRQLFADFATAELSAPAERIRLRPISSRFATPAALSWKITRLRDTARRKPRRNPNAWSWRNGGQAGVIRKRGRERFRRAEPPSDVSLFSAMDRRPVDRADAKGGARSRHAHRSHRRPCRRHEQSRQSRLEHARRYPHRRRIGAPPDLYNRNGQDWGLTTFSPRALNARGFEPFLQTCAPACDIPAGFASITPWGCCASGSFPSGRSRRRVRI